MVEVQPKFKTELLEAVTVFKEDVSQFETAYETVNAFSSGREDLYSVFQCFWFAGVGCQNFILVSY